MYSQYQPIYDKINQLKVFKSVSLIKGLNIDYEKLRDTILCVDDQMQEMNQDKEMQKVFTRLSHHQNVTIISLTQNVYPPGKYSKTIRLNLHYYILMKSFALEGQIQTLGTQLFRRKKNFLLEAYLKSTLNPFSYLVVILHPRWEEPYRVISNIFPKEHLSVFIHEK